MCVKMRSVKGPGVWPRAGPGPAAVGSEREARQQEPCRWGCGTEGGKAGGRVEEAQPSPAQTAQLEAWPDSLLKTPRGERKQFCGGSFLYFKSSRQCVIPSSKLCI